MHHRSGTGRFDFVKRMLVLVTVGAALAVLAPAPTWAQAPTADALKQQEDRLFLLTNQTRVQYGLAPLTRAPELNAAARTHSLDMAATCTLSHAGSDGSQPWDRMKAAGYNWTAAAENIVDGQPTADAAFNTWLNEAPDANGKRGHRDNILSADYKEIGISVVFSAQCGANGFYWTQDFGDRPGAPASGPVPTATPPPAAWPTGTEPGTLNLTAITADGKLWHTIRYIDGHWSLFGDVEAQIGNRGPIVDAAAKLIGSGANAALHVYTITSDGKLWYTIRSPDGNWAPFGDVAAAAGDRGRFVSVALANVNDELHVLAVTSDGKLWHSIRDANGNWTPFGDVKGQAGDPGAFARVAATVLQDASNGAQGLYVLGVTADGGLYQTVRGANGNWTSFGRTSQSSSGAFVECAVTFTGTQRDLAEVMSGGQLSLASDSFGATAAAGQIEPLGSLLAGPVTDVSIAPASNGSPLVHLAAVTSNGGIWHQIGSPGAWSGFGDVKGQTGDPGVAISVSVDVLR